MVEPIKQAGYPVSLDAVSCLLEKINRSSLPQPMRSRLQVSISLVIKTSASPDSRFHGGSSVALDLKPRPHGVRLLESVQNW